MRPACEAALACCARPPSSRAPPRSRCAGGTAGLRLARPGVACELPSFKPSCPCPSPLHARLQEDIAARGGRPWDTVKPLRKYFNGLARLALVDDSGGLALAGDAACWLVPCRFLKGWKLRRAAPGWAVAPLHNMRRAYGTPPRTHPSRPPAAHKAAAAEGANMLLMPCWHGPAHPLGRGDPCLPLLVEELLAWVQQHAAAVADGAAAAAAVAAAGAAAAADAAADAAGAGPEAGAKEAARGAAPALDVRRATAGISAKLAAAAQQQLDSARAAGQLTQEQAAAAAAVVEAAVSGTAAVAAAAAAAEEAGWEEVSSPRHAAQRGAKQLLKEAHAEVVAVARAAGETVRAEAAARGEHVPGEPPTKRQRSAQQAERQERQLQAARTLLLAAAAAASLAAGSGEGGGGATLAEVNAYLNHWQPELAAYLLDKTAKRELSNAVKLGLAELVPEAAPAPAAAAAAPAPAAPAAGAVPAAAGGASGGRRHRLTPAGAAAAPGEQYVQALGAYCRQFACKADCQKHIQAQQRGDAAAGGKLSGKKRRRGGAGGGAAAEEEQAQQAQQAAAGDADMLDVDAGFFWQKKQGGEAQQAQQPQQAQQAQQPEQQQQQQQQQQQGGAAGAAGAAGDGVLLPSPAPVGADAPAMQQGAVLHALTVLQQRRGAAFADLEAWVHRQLAAQHPHLGLCDATAPKRQKAAARCLRLLLQRGLDASEKVRGGAWRRVLGWAAPEGPLLLGYRSHCCIRLPPRLHNAMPPTRPLRSLCPGLQEGTLVPSRVGPDMPPQLVLWSRGNAAPPAGDAAELAAALQVLAAALGPAAPAAAAAAPPASDRQQASSEVAAAAPAGAAEAAVGGEGQAEATVPLLLEVFEDRAAALPPAAAAAAAPAQPAPLAVFEDRAPAAAAQQAAPQQEQQQAQAQQAQQAQQQQLFPGLADPRFDPLMTVQQLRAEGKRYLKAMQKKLGFKKSAGEREGAHRRLRKGHAFVWSGCVVPPAAGGAAGLGLVWAAGECTFLSLAPWKPPATRPSLACRPLWPTLHADGQVKRQYRLAKKALDRRLKEAVARRNRAEKEAAAAALDRLFEAAARGSELAWQAALGQLSPLERAALEAKGVDLEKYRQGLAARAPGGDGETGQAGGAEEGSSGGSSEEEGSEGEGSSGDEEASSSEAEEEEEEEEEEEAGSSETEEGSEWSTASESEGEEEEEPAAARGAAARPPTRFWERRQQRGQQGFSPLHFEVDAFAQRATPTQEEVCCGCCWCCDGWGWRWALLHPLLASALARRFACSLTCIPQLACRCWLANSAGCWHPTPCLLCGCPCAAGGGGAECGQGSGCRLARAVAALARRALWLAGAAPCNRCCTRSAPKCHRQALQESVRSVQDGAELFEAAASSGANTPVPAAVPSIPPARRPPAWRCPAATWTLLCLGWAPP